jgi:translation initiation factor IF-3
MFDGQNLGVMKTQEALRVAQQQELDLVVISEGAKPPVCKILDFNKFLYEERKKLSATKAKSKKSELKEFRFGPTIGDSDLETRINRAQEFIENGDRVKITIKLKGREREFPNIGFEKITKFSDGLASVARLESQPRLMGNMIIATFVTK